MDGDFSPDRRYCSTNEPTRETSVKKGGSDGSRLQGAKSFSTQARAVYAELQPYRLHQYPQGGARRLDLRIKFADRPARRTAWLRAFVPNREVARLWRRDQLSRDIVGNHDMGLGAARAHFAHQYFFNRACADVSSGGDRENGFDARSSEPRPVGPERGQWLERARIRHDGN